MRIMTRFHSGFGIQVREHSRWDSGRSPVAAITWPEPRICTISCCWLRNRFITFWSVRTTARFARFKVTTKPRQPRYDQSKKFRLLLDPGQLLLKDI